MERRFKNLLGGSVVAALSLAAFRAEVGSRETPRPQGRTIGAKEWIELISDATRHKDGSAEEKKNTSSSDEGRSSKEKPVAPERKSPLMRAPGTDDAFDNKWDA
jgi:hypothetical protein